jgi:diguanylate cyclase (GGDEF)-like protein
VETGSQATLSLDVGAASESPGEAVVIIENAYGDCITLQFDPAERETASRFRELISGGFAPGFGSAPQPQVPPVVPAQKSPAENIEPEKPKPFIDPDIPLTVKPPTMGATAEYNDLLDKVRSESLAELENALYPFFEDLAAHLQKISEKSGEADRGKNPYYQASRRISREGRAFTQVLLSRLGEYFRDLTPEEQDDQLWRYSIGSAEELDLIDQREFEDFLTINRMVSMGEEMHQVSLEALIARLATLIDTDLNNLRLPIHVRQLCRAFQHTLTALELPKQVLPASFDYFSTRFIKQLAGFYAPLNTMLQEAGIRPGVEEEIRRNGTLLNLEPVIPKREPRIRAVRKARPKPEEDPQLLTSSAPPPPDSGPESPPDAAENRERDNFHRKLGEQLTGVLGNIEPASLYRSVVDAMNFKREAEGLADGAVLDSGTAVSGTWDGATVPSTDLDQSKLADAQSIARALSALQRDTQAREDVQQSNSLRAYLASKKEEIGGLQDTSGLTAESLNQLDMVDNLFDTIKDKLDVSDEMKPALGNLQIPLAKLALMEPRFFVDHSHNARAVVDKLTHLATSANFPNKALETRINNIVEHIISDYESDSSVFDEALSNIDRLAAQQERAMTRNVERVVRTQEGQQRLAEARRSVARMISSRINSAQAPKVLMDLVEGGWRDLMVLTHVREGEESEAWSQQKNTLEQLCSWLESRQAGAGGDELLEHSLEAESLIESLGEQISAALPTNIQHVEVLDQLRNVLTGDVEVETADVTDGLTVAEPEPEEVRARIEDLPRLRRWVKRVEELEPNSWLTYRDSGGNRKRMQLAWVSPDKDRFIFVNDRGQKAADLSAIGLARQLSRGVQPPAPADQLSIVDQSMFHTLEHVQKTLSFARNHDSLTRLINRETFLDQVDRAMRHSQAKESQHALLYLNIDQFGLVNEVYDRVSGDQVLLEFARLLAQLHGKKSSSARLDADEFGILLLDRPLESALQIAEKIRADIESSSMDIEGESVSFTVSIGVAGIAEHSPGVEAILESARSAMQTAKQKGRNRVIPFEEDQSSALDYRNERKRKREDLEKALATERFVLQAQPIVHTAIGDTADTSLHYELLLGLSNKDGTLSSPEEFIQSAERYGFMILVDRWVVREAFKWISQLMDDQKVVPNLAINLSGDSVTDDSFMDYLFEQISEFGVGTSKLCFEITETGTISNLVKAADFVRAFRNIGCKFSIDDFGTGLASHNYLRELPVDYVKIDGSFVTGINKNRNDYAMARSINDLAHFLGQKTIAESVESEDIVVKLEEIGVDYLQGWGVGRPKPLLEVTADLSNLEK